MTNATQTRPWESRSDWATGRISGGSPLGASILMWFFVIFWCGISSLAAWSILTGHYLTLRSKHGGLQTEMPIIFQGVFAIGFPLIGLGLLIYAVSMTRSALRFGRSLFILDSVPCAPGGTLSGVIKCGVSPQLEAAFDLKLQCDYNWYSSTGNDRTLNTSILWSDEYECAGAKDVDAVDSSTVMVLFNIPEQAQVTGPYQSGKVAWTLTASATVPGVGYRDSFEVPVFAGIPTPSSRTREPSVSTKTARGPVHGLVRLEEMDNQLRVTYPPAMNPAFAYLCFMGLVVTVWTEYGYFGHDQAIAGGITGLFAALFLYMTARAYLMRTTVTISGTEFTIARSIFFLVWRKNIDPGMIQDIAAAPSAQRGSEQLYKLKVLLKRGTIGIGSMLTSRSEAEHIRSMMLSNLGKSDSTTAGVPPVDPDEAISS